METQDLQNNTEANAQASNVLNREYTFNFRKQSLENAAESLDTDMEGLAKPENTKKFKFLDGDGKEVESLEDAKHVKRKSITVTLALPEFLKQLPEAEQEPVASIIEDRVATYVKQNYIDKFEPVGDHSWETIKTWMNSRGRSVKWDFSDETLKAAALAFGRFCEEAISVPGIGKRLEQAAKQRFSRNAIQRQTAKFDEEVVKKLQSWIDQFMGYVLENDEDNAEDWEPVYRCWSEALNRHLRSDNKQVDLAQVL